MDNKIDKHYIDVEAANQDILELWQHLINF